MWWLCGPGAIPCSPLKTDCLRAVYWARLFSKDTMSIWICLLLWPLSVAIFSISPPINRIIFFLQNFTESLNILLVLMHFSSFPQFSRKTVSSAGDPHPFAWCDKTNEDNTSKPWIQCQIAQFSLIHWSAIGDCHSIQIICCRHRWWKCSKLLTWWLYSDHVLLACKWDVETHA